MLKIYTRANPALRRQLLEEAQWTSPPNRVWAGLGFFWWNKQVPATNDVQPVLWTSDAASCVILVLSCGNGHGAIGHTTETSSVDLVVRAAEQMHGMMGLQRETLIFAGGENFTARQRDDVVTRTRGLAPHVTWRSDLDNTNTTRPYSAAVYLPTRDALLLYDEIRDPDAPTMQAANGAVDPQKFDARAFDLQQ